MVEGVSGTTALMVLNSGNGATAWRRPGHRSPKQDGRLQPGGLRFQHESTAGPVSPVSVDIKQSKPRAS